MGALDIEVDVLGSCSDANGYLVRSPEAAILIECGFSLQTLENKLASVGCDPGALDGVLVSHEHGDHMSGVGRLARRYEVPIYANQTTLDLGKKHLGKGTKGHLRPFETLEPFTIGDMTVRAIPVPHDAGEPVGFVMQHGRPGHQEARRLGFLTDFGVPTPLIEREFSDLDFLLVDCNYDVGLLKEGNYPLTVKHRIASNAGHLSNEASGKLISRLVGHRTEQVMLAHLSLNNNNEDLARQAVEIWLARRLKWSDVMVAAAHEITGGLIV